MKRYILLFGCCLLVSMGCLAQQKNTVTKTKTEPTVEELYQKYIDYILEEKGAEDPVKAKELLWLSVNKGYAKAFVEMSYYEEKHSAAIVWLKKAAVQNCPDAMYPLFLIYRNGGSDVTPDINEANKWLEKGAELGCPKCQWLLGSNYHYGEDGYSVNVSQAISWLEKAAFQNHDAAMEQLGELFQDGKLTKRDINKTLYWYQKASDLGNIAAKERMALMYLYGDGASIDEEKSFNLMREAASSGSSTAQIKLGIMFNDGLGCKKSRYAAEYWWRTALENSKTSIEDKKVLKELLGE